MLNKLITFATTAACTFALAATTDTCVDPQPSHYIPAYQEGTANRSDTREYRRTFSREEYLEFFQREVRRHSEGALDCQWSNELGFHTVALREIGHRQFFIWLPAKYVLTVWSDFKYKPLISETIRAMTADPAFAHFQVPQHLILAIRLLSSFKEYGTVPREEMNFGLVHEGEEATEEDELFMNKILAYYAQLPLDDFAVWTPEDIAYYNKHGFAYDAPMDRRWFYDRFLEALAANITEEKATLLNLISNFTEVNHWWSVVSTRNHGGYETWMRELSGLEGWAEIVKVRENEVWRSKYINLLLPLIDIPNHYHPERADKSDYYNFNLRVYPTAPGHSRHQRSIGLSTGHPVIRVGQQVDYAYNPNLEAFKLLLGYGFAVDNNPFAQTAIRIPNHLLSMGADQVLTCRLLGCTDAYFEGDANKTALFYERLSLEG
jgi:hypothetical protein